MNETPRREAPTAPQPAPVPGGIHLLRRITLRNFVIATSILQLVLCAVLVIAAWDYYPHEVSRIRLQVGTKAYSDFHIRPGEIAFWNDRLVYVTWNGDKHIVILDAKDGSILAKVPADMIWPTPAPIVHASGDSLYLMYYDQVKGWCIATANGNKVETKPVFPNAGYRQKDRTWHALSPEQPYVTWRLADFQIRYDGALEGLASVFVADSGVTLDSEDNYYADFWFEMRGGKSSFTLIGKHKTDDFVLLPSKKGLSSGFVTRERDSFLLQEIAIDKFGRLRRGAQKKLSFEMPNDETVDSFAVAQGPDDSALYLLINTYRVKINVSPFIDPSENQTWKCIAIDRASFKIEEKKELDRRADSYRFHFDKYRIDWDGDWTIMLGSEWDEGKSSLLAYNEARDKLKVARIGAKFQNDKNTLGFGTCGIAHKSPGEVYLAYLRRFGPSEDSRQIELRIYRLSLPE